MVFENNSVENNVKVDPIERVRNVPDTESNLNKVFYLISTFVTFIGISIVRKAKRKNK